MWDYYVQHILFYCALLYCFSQVLHFLQVEGKILHRQKENDSFYCNTHLITVVWNQTCKYLWGQLVLSKKALTVTSSILTRRQVEMWQIKRKWEMGHWKQKSEWCEEGVMSKGCRKSPEARKCEETEPPEGFSPANTFTLAQWNWFQTFDFQ